MRCASRAISLVLLLGTVASPTNGQVAVGLHATAIIDVDQYAPSGPGTFEGLGGALGIGGRMLFRPAAAPIAVVAAAEYYFADCGPLECRLWTASAGVNLYLPVRDFRPYLHGAVQYREDQLFRDFLADDSLTAWVVGVGVEVDFAVSLVFEGLAEIVDDPPGFCCGFLDLDPLVLKVGVIL